MDFIELAAGDMEKIASIDKNKRFNDPSTSFGYVFFADEKPAYKSGKIESQLTSYSGNVAHNCFAALDAITNAGKKARQAAQSAVGQA